MVCDRFLWRDWRFRQRRCHSFLAFPFGYPGKRGRDPHVHFLATAGDRFSSRLDARIKMEVLVTPSEHVLLLGTVLSVALDRGLAGSERSFLLSRVVRRRRLKRGRRTGSCAKLRERRWA